MNRHADRNAGRNPPGKTAESSPARRRRRRTLFLLIFTGVLVPCGFLAWRLFADATLSPEMEASFSIGEKRQILAAVRADAFRQTWTAIKGRRFEDALGWFSSAWKRKTVSVGKQGNGDVWIHVGILDRKAPGGYSIWSRHILRQQNGQWRIVWSF